MDILRTRALRGPNRWSRHTAIQATISCTPQEYRVDQLEGFEARLRARLPDIGMSAAAGEFAALSLAQVLALAALALQAQAGCAVAFCHGTPGLTPGIFFAIVQYTEEAVGMLAVELAEALCKAALSDTPFELADALQHLRQLDATVRLGPSAQAIVRNAAARDIPFRRLTAGSKVVLGWGSRQRRLQAQAARMDDTAAIGEAIAKDRVLTRKLLDAAGLQVPAGRVISTADDGWAWAQKVGLPVAVKPRYGNQGRGVTLDVSTRPHFEAAMRAAGEVHEQVLVERCLPGEHFYLLVIEHRLVAAARRPPRQTGGTDSRSDDVSDVTDEVHPAVAALAIEAAGMTGLNICGVELVCASVQRPIDEQQGAVTSVNGAPDLRVFLSPAFGDGRRVVDAIVSSLFPNGEDGRIPVVAVTGTNGKTTTVRLIAHLFTASGLRTGMTNTSGVYYEGVRVERGDCSGPRSARKVLAHPGVDAAVFEIARGGLLREGLAFDRCQVAVVTNVGVGDHLGLNHIDTVDDLARLKRTIVENVGDGGMAVLNADDARVAAMALACRGEVTFFGRRANPVMSAHLKSGRRVVYIEDGQLVATDGAMRHTVALSAVPLTVGGSIGFQVENVMAAVAAAWAAGVDWDAIRRGLGTFINHPDMTPGRFNVLRYRDATVIADYGHNRDAMLALVAAVETMPARRRSVVTSAAAGRRDDDLRQQAGILGRAFDEVLLYQESARNGPEEGALLRQLRAGLDGATRTARVDEIDGELLAIDRALDRLQQGDLCLVLISQVDKSLAHLASRGARAA